MTPNQYVEGQKIPLLVNKLTSVKTQLPYRYYTLPFCEPEGVIAGAGLVTACE